MRRTLSTRLNPEDHLAVEVLVALGLFESRSEAGRILVKDALEKYKALVDPYIEASKLLENFDVWYRENQAEEPKVLERLERIRDLLKRFPILIRIRLEGESKLLGAAQDNLNFYWK